MTHPYIIHRKNSQMNMKKFKTLGILFNKIMRDFEMQKGKYLYSHGIRTK